MIEHPAHLGAGIYASAYRSEIDGRLVVQLDTDPDVAPHDEHGAPELRVYVNDGLVWGEPANPAKEEAPHE